MSDEFSMLGTKCLTGGHDYQRLYTVEVELVAVKQELFDLTDADCRCGVDKYNEFSQYN